MINNHGGFFVCHKNQAQDSAITKRFSLHDIASRLMTDSLFNSADQQSLIDQGKLPRVCGCQKVPLISDSNPNNSNLSIFVPVYKNLESGKAHFGGLRSCGSVWACPICAEKIAHGRGEELQIAFNTWRSLNPDNNFTLMVSFTIPHYFDDRLKKTRAKFMKARRNLKKQDILKRPSVHTGKTLKVFSQIRDDYGIFGTVTAFESTWGVNGHHPHSHDIFFTTRPEFKSTNGHLLNLLKLDLSEAWFHACCRAGVKIKNKSDFLEHSIHVRRAPTPADYIAKWGIIDFEKHQDKLKKWGAAQELTKAHIKRSRGEKGMSPWDMLRLIQQFPDDRSIYLKFGRLWREFVDVMSGHSQLHWEKGFKSFLSEKSASFADVSKLQDQDLAELETGKKELLGILTPREWQLVLRKKIRGQVLYLSALVPFEDVRAFIHNSENNLLKKAVANE